MRMFGVFMTACIFLIWGAAPAYAQKSCGLWGAEYVPQNQSISDSYDPSENLINRTLSFVLRIATGDMEGPQRSTFLNFDTYDRTGEKVRTMRLGSVWSNGV